MSGCTAVGEPVEEGVECAGRRLKKKKENALGSDSDEKTCKHRPLPPATAAHCRIEQSSTDEVLEHWLDLTKEKTAADETGEDGGPPVAAFRRLLRPFVDLVIPQGRLALQASVEERGNDAVSDAAASESASLTDEERRGRVREEKSAREGRERGEHVE